MKPQPGSATLHPQFRRIRIVLWALLKVLVSVGLLIYLAWRLDTKALLRAVYVVPATCWLSMGATTMAFLCCKIAKWHVLARFNGLTASLHEVSRAYLVSLAVGTLTPGRVGEAARITPFKGEQTSRAIILYIYDRMAELACVLVVSIPGAVLLGRWYALALCVASTALALLLVAVTGRHAVWRRLAELPTFVPGKAMAALARAQMATPASFWVLTMLTYVWGYLLAAIFIVGTTPVADWRFVLLLPVVTLSNIVPVTIAGLGMREGMATAVMPQCGIPPETAAMAFFVCFVMTILVPGCVGVLWSLAASGTVRNIKTP